MPIFKKGNYVNNLMAEKPHSQVDTPPLALLETHFPVLVFGLDGQIRDGNSAWNSIDAVLGGSYFELRANLISLFMEKFEEMGADADTATHEIPMELQDIMSPCYDTLLLSRISCPNDKTAEGYVAALIDTQANHKDEHVRTAWEAMRFLSRQDQMFTVYYWRVFKEDGAMKLFATENFVHEKRARKAHQVTANLANLSDQVTIYNEKETKKYLAGLAGTRKNGSMIVHLHSVKGYDKYYHLNGKGIQTPGRDSLCEGLAIDITDKVLAKESQESRAQMNLCQFTMLGLSQELSNMVTTMEGTLAMLEPEDIEAMSKDELLSEIEDLKAQLGRGKLVSKSFLKLAKKSSSTRMSKTLVEDDISGVRLTESCCTRIAGTLDSISPGFEIEFVKRVSEHSVLPMSEVQLAGAVLSLASNSFHAMRDREAAEGDSYVPTLKITAEAFDHNPFALPERRKLPEGEGIIAFTVEDNGIGMSSEVAKMAAQPHFTTRPDTSIGMGLTTLQQLTSSYLGNIDIKSRPGKGSKVTFWVPIKA